MSSLYVEGETLVVELSLHGVYVASRVLEPGGALLAIGRKHGEARGVSPPPAKQDLGY
ncbi:hypothetical protein [Infirmifilum sp.]|uniref:hypothetical protein n=1 Tax=Infirmifilum sp. TaxID=2856575 RepID=UPI003D097FBC